MLSSRELWWQTRPTQHTDKQSESECVQESVIE